jgi:hypothetical protein
MSIILDNKNPSSPSVFHPAALLREARRQKGLLFEFSSIYLALARWSCGVVDTHCGR